MRQHSRLQSILYHLYPGILITLFFIIVTPVFVKNGLPPQLSMLLAIAVVITPVIWIHLLKAKRKENVKRIIDLIPYNEKISSKKIGLYTVGLILFAYIIYGLTLQINELITDKIFFWLPDWYKVRDFTGYSKNIIIITLICNIFLNGILAPLLEELYFRGYLMPRMSSWGKGVPLINTILFSLYHFWQPQIYLTLIISLLPMIYLTWKTKSLRLAIYTHCGLNIVGALLSLASIFQ